MANTYDTYKDSGVAWIGEIPSGWEVVRIKNIYSERTELSENGTERLLSVSEYYGITPTSEKIDVGEFITRADSLVGYKKCYINDFVSNIMLAWKGSFGTTKFDGIVSPAYCIYKPVDTISPSYYHYLFRTDLYKSRFKSYSKGIIDSRLRLYSPFFYLVDAILPPKLEQQSIATFLDQKCNEIDSLIALQDEMIGELQAYKQSVITEVVTKGLDPNAKMKDSGVEWIGEIPEGWSTKRLKFLCRITTGDKDTQDSEKEGVYKFYVRSPIIEHSNSWTFEGEGILMAGDGAGAGRVFHHAFGKYAVHQRVYRMANFKEVNTYFLFYYLSSLFCKIMDMGSAQSTVPSVRMPMLTNFVVCMPAFNEQQLIVDYLKNRTSQIDSLISLKQQKIAELKDYKKSIIYEYVTGKKKV